MSLLDFLPKMRLGFKGAKPKFNAEDKISTLHNQSSTTGNPVYNRNPSILDEADSANSSKYKSTKGKKYSDQLFK
jgi:hypothetical protein